MAASQLGRDDRAGRSVAARGFGLAVDPIACDAHGMCAELVPERITLDEWGYPIISSEVVDGAMLEHARRAVTACPTLALKLRARKR